MRWGEKEKENNMKMRRTCLERGPGCVCACQPEGAANALVEPPDGGPGQSGSAPSAGPGMSTGEGSSAPKCGCACVCA